MKTKRNLYLLVSFGTENIWIWFYEASATLILWLLFFMLFIPIHLATLAIEIILFLNRNSAQTFFICAVSIFYPYRWTQIHVGIYHLSWMRFIYTFCWLCLAMDRNVYYVLVYVCSSWMDTLNAFCYGKTADRLTDGICIMKAIVKIQPTTTIHVRSSDSRKCLLKWAHNQNDLEIEMRKLCDLNLLLNVCA